jgi:hypothetical protein
MAERPSDCLTCYGTGEVVGERGAVACPDCYGDGKAATSGNKFEWRLRDLERSWRMHPGAGLGDVMWLIHELRQARNALVLILSRCQDAEESDEAARYVRRQAMEALRLYDRAGDEDVEKGGRR